MLWMARKWKLDGQPGTVLQKLWIEILIARKFVRPYAGKSFHIQIKKLGQQEIGSWVASRISPKVNWH